MDSLTYHGLLQAVLSVCQTGTQVLNFCPSGSLSAYPQPLGTALQQLLPRKDVFFLLKTQLFLLEFDSGQLFLLSVMSSTWHWWVMGIKV